MRKYEIIRSILSHQEIFGKLLARYMDLRTLRLIQRSKKVFFSQNEQNHYDQVLMETLHFYYIDLFDEMILPIADELVAIREYVSPIILNSILEGENISWDTNHYYL